MRAHAREISRFTHMCPGLQEVNWEAAGEVWPQRLPVCFVMLLCSSKCILRALTKWLSFNTQILIFVVFKGRGAVVC